MVISNLPLMKEVTGFASLSPELKLGRTGESPAKMVGHEQGMSYEWGNAGLIQPISHSQNLQRLIQCPFLWLCVWSNTRLTFTEMGIVADAEVFF